MGINDVEVTTLCDPDAEVSAKRAAEFEAKYGQKVKTVQDLRTVFDDKTIDVVTIATLNHWHALATIWACQAGKDVYVEKPGAHNIWEGDVHLPTTDGRRLILSRYTQPEKAPLLLLRQLRLNLPDQPRPKITGQQPGVN